MRGLLWRFSIVALFATTLGVQISSPLKVIYIDWENINWNTPQDTVLAAAEAGFNVVIISFYLSGSGPTGRDTFSFYFIFKIRKIWLKHGRV